MTFKLKTKKIMLLLLSCLVVFYYVFPSGRYTLTAMITCMVEMSCCLMFINDKTIRDNLLKIALLMIFLSILYFLVTYPFDLDKALGIITQQFLFVFPAFLLYFWSNNKMTTAVYVLFLAVPAVYIITITMKEIVVNPTIVRALAAGSSTTIDLVSYRMANIGGFAFAYGMMFMAIALFFAFFKIKRSIVFLAGLLLTTIFVIQTQYLMAILLMFVCMYGVLFYGSYDKRKKLIVLFFVLVGTLIAVPYLLTWLASIIDNQSISMKLEQIATLLRFGVDFSTSQGGLYGRLKVYRMSLELFGKSPIFGNTITSLVSLGEHSTLLDLGARAGILGILVFIGELKVVFTLIQKSMDLSGISDAFSTYLIVTLYALLSVLNPTMNNFEIGFYAFFFAPLTIIYSYRMKERKQQ